MTSEQIERLLRALETLANETAYVRAELEKLADTQNRLLLVIIESERK